jgi:monomeric isocitrate dehydrogenase
MDKFFDLFLKENAKYSLFDKFLQRQGDTNITVDDWVHNGNGRQHNIIETLLKRTVYYTHPVNVPMAPPTASTRREQSLKQYYNTNNKKKLHGICIESKTYVDNVPMADSFYSTERMMIITSSDSISIKVDYGLNFF